MDGSADCRLISKNTIGELLSNQANLIVLLHVIGIKISSVHDDQVPNILVALRYADKGYGMLYPINYNRGIHVAGSRNFHYARNRILNGGHIGERDFVTQRGGFPGGVNGGGVDNVRADAFNLSNNELTSSKRDCNDEDDTCAADDHPQHGQERAKFVRSKRVNRNKNCFTS